MKMKGQSLPLNAIVIAIIVLVVLVVLIAIFTGRIALFDKKVDDLGDVGLAGVGAACSAKFADGDPSGVCAQTCSSELKTSRKWIGADVKMWCGLGLVCCKP